MPHSATLSQATIRWGGTRLPSFLSLCLGHRERPWEERCPRAGFEYPQRCPWDHRSSSAEAPTVSCSLGKELTLPPFLTVLFNTLLTLKSRHITSQQSTSIRGKIDACRDTQSVGPWAPLSYGYGYVTAHKLLSQTRFLPPFGAKPTRLLFAFNATVNP